MQVFAASVRSNLSLRNEPSAFGAFGSCNRSIRHSGVRSKNCRWLSRGFTWRHRQEVFSKDVRPNQSENASKR